MTDAKINSGVALLLERMKTNPEEFTQDPKWLGIIRSYKEYLNEEDLKVLDAGINELMQQKFTEIVLEELVDPKKSSLEGIIEQYRAKGITSVGQTLASSMAQSKAMSNGATLTVSTNPNSLTLGSTTINESHLEHMKAHLEVLEMAKKAEVKKEVKTIFGKLFNYL